MSKTQYPAGPKARYPGELLFHVRRDPIDFCRQLSEYGPIAQFKIGPQRYFFLNDPELVREALVTKNRFLEKVGALRRAKIVIGEGLLVAEREEHMARRRMLQPSFHKTRISHFADVMAYYADTLSARWQSDQPFDVWGQMLDLTLSIVGKTLFGADDLESEAPEVEAAVAVLLNVLDLVALPGSKYFMKLPTKKNKQTWAAIARLNKTIYRLIDERRKTDKQDLLAMLIAASEDDQRLSNDQVRDEAMTLFIAGHETTANGLAWMWYVLGQHPEVEAAFHAEIDAVLGDRLPTFEDIPKLVVTEQIVSEAMRLYPPAWSILRRVTEDITIGEWKVPQDSQIIMSSYTMHRNTDYWPEPERFDLSRWTPEAKAARPHFAFFPFGGGPRSCIGEPFAWMESIIVLATIGRRWRLKLVPGHEVVKQPLISLRPVTGIKVTAEPRKVTASVPVAVG